MKKGLAYSQKYITLYKSTLEKIFIYFNEIQLRFIISAFLIYKFTKIH